MKKDPLIGQRLANFRVDKPLGRGGMAQVYFGIDISLERPVAIKVIDARYQADPEFARRFVDEAKLIARWRHENIVQVYYAGNEEDVYFYAMEFVDGLSLEALMQRYLEQGTLMPHEEVLKIGRAVAGALDYAHKQGVVHRDIKPSNIMVSRDDRVVLMDFGLALDMGQGSMGQVFGTPHYISPEQARKSSDATAQSDVYSFGVVLYEMMVGSIPFDDPSAASVAVQHITQEPPPPTLINPALNDAIEKVLLKALAKSPEERYKTATQMIEALAEAIAKLNSSESASTAILPPAMPSTSPRLSRTSISQMLALGLDDDEEDERSTIHSLRDLNPKHKSATQEVKAIRDAATKLSQENKTRDMKALQKPEPEAAAPAPSGANKTGILVAIGAAIVVVLVVVVAILLMNPSASTDTTPTETALAQQAADLQATLDNAGTLTSVAQSQAQVTSTATEDLGATATAIILTNDAINASNTTVAETNAVVLGQATNEAGLAQTQAANDVLATSNAYLQSTLTAQAFIPSPTAQATAPAFANGLPVEISYNSAGFYLRNNSSEANIRLSNLSFRALDANGNSVGVEFSGVDWTRFYGNVDRNGRCVAIELLDQSAWTRPNNCVDYNSQLTFPTNDQRIFWDGRNGASQFAVYWAGTEAGRCVAGTGVCTILVGR